VELFNLLITLTKMAYTVVLTVQMRKGSRDRAQYYLLVSGRAVYEEQPWATD